MKSRNSGQYWTYGDAVRTAVGESAGKSEVIRNRTKKTKGRTTGPAFSQIPLNTNTGEQPASDTPSSYPIRRLLIVTRTGDKGKKPNWGTTDGESPAERTRAEARLQCSG
jgi:hypothetical protein